MTDQATTPEQPKPDPNELLQLPQMTRAEIGNLVQCVDAVRRGCPIEQVPTVMALIDKLVSATPVVKPLGNRATRRGKASQK